MNSYESPFSSRYASKEMSNIFSQEHRILLFRKLWLSLATAQKQLGLPITETQIAQMKENLTNISLETAREYEKRFRHDVMAHIHAFGDECPDAKKIIHLGATSTFVTDNADLIQIKEALSLLLQKLAYTIQELASFAQKHADTPCLGYTHYQAAQPTTIGKRAALWLQDLLMDAIEWQRQLKQLPFLGVKGATGTQASFLSLFEGDEKKVEQLERQLAADFNFEHTIPICGQTYPRKIDLMLLHTLNAFGAGVHKMATDLRLLAHDGELFESREKEQVGSSAMPYKRNPILSERICGIARFLMSLDQNAAATLSTQWLERSLDDSSNRRLVLSQAFLSADSLFNILIPLIQTLQVHPERCKERIEEMLPHLIMENILMSSVKKGKNRQEIHEKLRLLSQKNALTAEIIAKDPSFGLSEQEAMQQCNLQKMVGRAPKQTLDFIKGPIHTFLNTVSFDSLALPPLEI